MAEDGEEKLLATVQHIAKTLGRTGTMTEDILKVFSNYDGRLSLDKLYAAAAAAGGGGAGEHSMSMPASSPPPVLPSAAAAAMPAPVTSLERTVRTLDRQISQFVTMERLVWADSADADAFLEAVDDLIGTVQELDAAGTNRGLLDRADELLSRCMARLEDEFRALIERPDDAAPAAPGGFDSEQSDDEDYDADDGYGDEPIPIAKPVTDFDVVIDALPPGSVSDVHQIARRMVDAGFGRECAEAYAAARRGFIDESVARLGIRSRTSDEVHSLPWEELEFDIARWIPAFKMVFRILIPSERRLSDRVFEGLAPYGDLAFVAAVRTQALQLISFGDAVAAASRAPERLFRVIDMYEAVRDLLPDLDPVFADPYSAALRAEVSAVCNTLGSSIKGIFMELENLIRRDPARVAVPGGGIHPITRYVMNYLRAACGSRQTLEEVMEGDLGALGVTAIAVDPDRPTSSLAVHIAWIMDVLHKNLESKSKIYRDPPLASIFLMNNGKYVIHKVNDSELGVLLGDDWMKQMLSRVRRWSMEYQRGAWAKVMSVLQTGGSGFSGLPPKAMLQKLQMFNGYLEEIRAAQSEWVITDDQLRADVKAAIADSVLPAYKGLIARLRSSPDAPQDLFIKHTPEDVEACIQHLFEGIGK
ncbi:exocyst complex component EXO70B1 [Aegilops tauschii subsp. strangulata]|uniref:Exocyst subunit Exo70 family protein n=2 Tax=Triticinae TaxID=1648030 RepID=A0A453FU99_AEGTS|nr:exocyst complex component EXO70B1 isoform X1 [Aegilops tauschii subsp. strangulata]XP_044358348.1 exocyst complex component EXO70B1-like [Triticum aestivum]